MEKPAGNDETEQQTEELHEGLRRKFLKQREIRDAVSQHGNTNDHHREHQVPVLIGILVLSSVGFAGVSIPIDRTDDNDADIIGNEIPQCQVNGERGDQTGDDNDDAQPDIERGGNWFLKQQICDAAKKVDLRNCESQLHGLAQCVGGFRETQQRQALAVHGVEQVGKHEQPRKLQEPVSVFSKQQPAESQGNAVYQNGAEIAQR